MFSPNNNNLAKTSSGPGFLIGEGSRPRELSEQVQRKATGHAMAASPSVIMDKLPKLHTAIWGS